MVNYLDRQHLSVITTDQEIIIICLGCGHAMTETEILTSLRVDRNRKIVQEVFVDHFIDSRTIIKKANRYMPCLPWVFILNI